MCVLSFSTSGLPSGESGSAAKKKHPAHPVEHTHTNTNTQSNINEKILQSLNHYGNEK